MTLRLSQKPARQWMVAVLLIIVATTLNGCVSQSNKPSNRPEDRTKVANLNTQLAIAYLRDGDNESALDKLQKATASDPNYAPAYSTMGILYSRIGVFDEADTNFRKALRIDPDNSSILNNYGQVLCQNGKHSAGQEMFLKANENPLYRTPEIAFSNAGTCAIAAGDNSGAEAFFRQALQINPRMPAALLQMSELNYDLERYLPARAYLQRFREVGRHSPRSLWLGVRIERQLGDKDALASYALQLQNGFPDSRETQLLLESKGS